MFMRDKETLIKARNDRDYLNDLIQNTEAKKLLSHAIKAYTKNPDRFMATNGVEYEELRQGAMIGLCYSIKHLDLDKTPNEWVRYTYLCIQSELRKFIRASSNGGIKITSDLRDMYGSYLVFHEQFYNDNYRDPTIDETMERFKINREDAFSLVYGTQALISSNASYSKVDDGNVKDITDMFIVRDSLYRDVEKTAINHVLVEDLLSCFDNTARSMLVAHYIYDYGLSEVAKMFGFANGGSVRRSIDRSIKRVMDKLAA